MYQYFKPIMKEEHMLYASEVGRAYRIYSVRKVSDPHVTKTVHTRLITEVINDYAEDNNIPNEVLYYQTSNGLARVYNEQLCRAALNEFLSKIHTARDVTQTYTAKSGTTYKFTL